METKKTLYFSGYRSFEFGVFQKEDPKITVIKHALTDKLREYLDLGLEWVITSGNLGTELWALEAAFALQPEYPELKTALIFPYQGFGEKWNEANQNYLQEISAQTDFVESTSHRPYEGKNQLVAHTQFLLQHTGGAVLVYDEEFPGKTQWFLRDARTYQEQTDYLLDFITMDDLQNTIIE